MTSDPEVIIVGGGVAGMAAAVALARIQVRSRVFESRSALGGIDRGDVLHRRSAEILAEWGMGTAEQHGALRLCAFRVLDNASRERLHVDLARRYPEGLLYSLGHREIEEWFLESAAGSDYIDVRLGTPVTRLLVEGGTVRGVSTADEAHPARLVVIAAGATSALRDACTSGVRRETYPSAFHNFRFASRSDVGAGAAYVVGEKGVAILLSLPHNTLRVGVQLGRRTVVGRSDVTAVIRRAYGSFDDRDLRLESHSVYSLRRITCPRRPAAGALLAGDALHTFHPTGGFGMNMAIRDARELATQVGAHGLTSGALARICDDYHDRRNSEARSVGRISHWLGRCGGSTNRIAAAGVRAAMKVIDGHEGMRYAFFDRWIH